MLVIADAPPRMAASRMGFPTRGFPVTGLAPENSIRNVVAASGQRAHCPR
jgi:hypothetical protein